MAKIGKLEVRMTPGRRTRIVKFPGHQLQIEHFFPENHEILKQIKRTVFIRSKLGKRPIFVRKDVSRNRSTKLEPTSEARLARFINNLKIPRLSVEAPLAAFLRSNSIHSIFYSYRHGIHFGSPGNSHYIKERNNVYNELKKHGINPFDAQWFSSKKGVALFDIEHFQVSEELKRKLGLKYIEPVYD